jgi:hypothetical protein
MAAMMPMIATTISSSMRVNPSFFCNFFTLFSWSPSGLGRCRRISGEDGRPDVIVSSLPQRRE